LITDTTKTRKDDDTDPGRQPVVAIDDVQCMGDTTDANYRHEKRKGDHLQQLIDTRDIEPVESCIQ